jgi:hypothetical protein
MLNKNFANPKSKAPIRKLTPEEWYKQQMAAGFLPAAAMDEAKVQELLKAGEYPSFYDPRKTTKDEKGGLLNKDGSTENVFIDYQYKAPKAPVIESKPVITPTGAGIEVGPYQTIDKNTGKTYHTGTDIEVKPQIYMGGKLVEEGKKKGGLVKKYETGGSVRVNGKDQTDSVVNQATDLATTSVNKTGGLGGMNPNATSAIAGGLGQVAMMGGAALDASNEVDQFGQINENKAAGATALKWGGSAAGIAANPALLAATGGLSLLAIPAAAGVGAIVGARKAGKENDLASQRIKEEQDAIKKQQSQSRVEEALRQRELGLAKGGKVVGAGTGTSDSIKAKVEADSFVVPAKNAPIAKELAEKVLRKAPNKKAQLMQKGGEPVKLSNGEYIFTPEEKAELEAKGINLDALAPEARKDLDEYMKCGGKVKGYAKGGVVGGDEEKMIAEERKKLAEYEAKLAKLQKDTEAARAKAETDKKRGEERSDIIDGLEKRMSDLRSAQKELAKAKAEFNAIDSSLKTYRSQVSSARNAPLSAGEKAGLKGSARPADDDILKNTKKLIGELEGKRKMIESAQKKIDYASDEKNYIPQTATAKTVKTATEAGGGIDWLSGDKPKEAATPKTTTAPTTTPTETKVAATKVAPKRTVSKPIVTAPTDQTAALTDKVLAENTMDAELADLSKYEEPVFPTTNPDITETGLAAKAISAKADGSPTPSAVTAQGGNANAAADEADDEADGNKFSATDLQGIIGYGVPLAQAAIGWNQLQKQGKRPVDKLDPDFLSRIDAAKARALTAEKEAMYGMTPEEKFLLNQQSQGLANQQRATARNQFASGSGGTALGLERMAINDAYGRGLMTKVQDKNLQLQKQAIAADRASTVDQLVGLKTEMNRRLFADEMNAWQQNQMAAGDLTSQGLTNLMAQNRYNQFLKNRQLEA